MLTPFQSGRKHAHHCRSDLKPLFNLMRWCSSFVAFVSVIVRLRNDLPGLTKQRACCKKPIRDSNSLFVHERLPCHHKISLLRWINFSSVRRSVIASVSSSIPRKVIIMEGPSVLWRASGTPALHRFPKCSLAPACTHQSLGSRRAENHPSSGFL